MLVTSRDRIEKLFDEGKTEQEVLALKPLADLDAKWGEQRHSTRSRIPATSTIRSSGCRSQRSRGAGRHCCRPRKSDQ